MNTYHYCSSEGNVLVNANATCENCRPVVVIDPEDREAVEQLAELLHEELGVSRFTDVQYALREFAKPKPPKPDEPKGLGAVVRDADGKKWMKVCGHYVCNGWRPLLVGSGGVYDIDKEIRREYAEIDVVEVLNEGVTE